jgi:outer membrane protein TolC
MKAIKVVTISGMLALGASLSHAKSQPAQNVEKRHLTLAEAIDLSLKASKELRVTRARLLQAQAAYSEARERRLPDVTISASYLRLLQPDIDLKLKLGNSSNSGSGSGSGTTEQQQSASPEVSQAAYAIANASLPVFTGFKIQSGIESAKYLAEAAKLDAENDRDDVIQNTVAAYTNLYKATEAVRLVQENLGSAQRRVKDLSNLEQNGLLARNDLLKAQLQVSNVELSLLEAENNLHITNENMDLMLGLPEETQLEPDSTFPTDTKERTLTEWEDAAFLNRKDAASLGYREKAAEQGIRAAKADYYPSVAITAGYIGAYIPNVITIKDAVNAGIGVRYSPSSLWKSNSKIAQAKARLAEVNANQAQLEDAIRLQTTRAYEAYLLGIKKIEVYRTAVAQAAENYRIVYNKNTNSLATTSELLDADVAQLQARLNYAFAKADAAVAYQKLLQTVGLISAEGVSSK